MTQRARDVADHANAIAIVGMACRFPGARNLEEFRRNLENGVESIALLTDEDLIAAGVDRSVSAHPDFVRAAPLLEDADKFDASFFEYSPREAIIMDPQQRLFLECAWEALEDADHAGTASGSLTGVFSGGGGIMSTYLLSDVHFNPQLTGTTASMQHVGNDKDYLSSRVSYKLNLRGPSLAVQTACSTSLVAIHLACQSLLTRECDRALAGGTTVRVPQRAGYLYKEGNVFSRDGHCRAFDADATGTVFGSGIGVVVLKRLKDALADRDPIRAIIRGTAINNDGSENKTSYWAPHAAGQAEAMRRALSVAGVDAHTIGYVEAHGTATKKGDPTEIRALTQAFGVQPPGSCALGSVKSNIGHPESAAGVAGVIKAVLSLEHKVLFPSLHYTRPNPEIDFAHGFYVNTATSPWPEGPFPRRAGVNALGIGGTNAFAILEEAPLQPHKPPAHERSCHVLTLSAKSPEALGALTRRYVAHLERHPEASFPDVCYSAAVGRMHFDHRLAVAAASAEEALGHLSAQPADRPAVPGARVVGAPRIAFLFTGQGSQRLDMGRELYETHAAFRDTVDECASSLAPLLDRPLLDVVYPPPGEPSPINDTAYTQPALFAIEYALATLWRSWGVEPSVVLGHSVGEIVAACVAGVMGLDDALRLTAERGRLMQALPRDGAMAAVRCDAARAGRAIASVSEHVSIAAINGPADVVISGQQDEVDAVLADLEREGVAATRLTVSHAFHSPLMEPMLDDFRRVAESIAFTPPGIPLMSNVTGQLAGPEVATPAYWVRHVREAVRFAAGIAACAQRADVLLEVGPSPVLLGMARHTVSGDSIALLPSLRPGRADWRQMADSLAALYVAGVDVDWTVFDREYGRHGVHLPTYPFQRKRFWMDAPATPHGAQVVSSRHALLGHRLRLPGSRETRFETRWSPDAPPYLTDHRLFDTVVVPGASHLAMTLSAVRDVSRSDACVLEDIVFPQALTLPDDGGRTAQLILSSSDPASEFRVMSLREGEDENDERSWVVHATGRRRAHDPGHSTLKGDIGSLADWRRRCTQPSTGRSFYDRFRDAGYHLRGSFRWIENIWAGDGEVLCELSWPELPDEAAAYPLYPSLIDACFQCVFTDKAGELLRDDAVYVPFSLRRFVFHGSPEPGATLWCHVRVSRPEDASRTGVDADITLCDAGGRPVADIDGCQLREVRRSALLQEGGRGLNDALYDVEWLVEPRRVAPEPDDGRVPAQWLVFADAATSVGDGLVQELRSRGERCVRVTVAERFRRVDADHYELDPAQPDDMQSLLRDALDGSRPACRGVVHLWSLDALPMAMPASRASRDCAGSSVLHLVQALARTGWDAPPRLWLVTRGAQPVPPVSPDLAVQQAPIWGLGRVIALEHPELACVRVDLDSAGGPDAVLQLVDEVWAPDHQDQVAYRQGVRFVPRLVRLAAPRDSAAAAPDPIEVQEQPFTIGLSGYGQLDNLVRRPLTRRTPGPGEVEIQVRATGLNLRDVLNALGLLAEHYAQHLGVTSAADMTFGFECVGTVAAVGEGVSRLTVGDDVMAVASHDALASFVTLRQEFVVRKPATLSFEDAATLPLAFLTAYYGLHRLARIQPGERVLIHAAAGGVGQACLQWARLVGAEVFATASPAKWDVLRADGVEHVLNSRTVDFAQSIRELTSGEGVDVVVNTLSGDFVDASFSVLRHGGRFVELGKRDVWSPEQARARRPDVDYLPFDLMEVARESPGVIAGMLDDMVSQLEAGTFTPLPRTVFPVDKVTDAFRYMAEARHVGKVVVSIASPSTSDEGAQTSVRADGSYLVTGGLGALGLLVAERLVDEGARHVVLTGRRPPDVAAQAAVKRLEAAGATVRVLQADVSEPPHVARVLSAIADSGPPLRGVVHAAGVLDDGVLLQQTWARFQHVMAPKVEGAWNLHAATQHLSLDFFVGFSSVASLVGNAGQGNYAAGNAFLDALAHLRRARGLAGLSINWGPWDDVGMAVSGEAHRGRRLADQGFRPIAPEQGVPMFAQLLRTPRAQVGVASISWPDFLRKNPTGLAFFERVAVPDAKGARQESDLRKRLAESADPRALLSQHVRTVVGRVLGMQDTGDVDPRARLFDLGLESLMAVELRGRFEDSLGCPLRPTLLFDYPTIESLTEHLAGRLAEVAAIVEAAQPAGPVSADAVDEFDGLDEDEIAERLARELSGAAKAL